MEPLKHECGVALIRLRRPLHYFKQKYGTYTYALDKLYLMMEKQHNRGQEAAGIGVIKLNAAAGNEFIFRERALGKDAITNIFATIGERLPDNLDSLPADEAESQLPFLGEVYMGHLRYSTTGCSGISFAHPVLRRSNWRARSLMICGNFNMTNVDRMFESVVASGQHPRIYSDTNLILDNLSLALDKENESLRSRLAATHSEPELTVAVENNLDFGNVLKQVAWEWDGGYVMCGATGSGDMFALRDPNGIRPAFYYVDDEIAVLASERPVIQTVFDLPASDVKELAPGAAFIVSQDASVKVEQILPRGENRRCSFERIYFSRGSDEDIYRERKALGANLVPRLLDMIDNDLDHTVFSFIPNTAEVAFFGMIQGLEQRLDQQKLSAIRSMLASGEANDEKLKKIFSHRVRVEKVAIKDVKMRTFIAEGNSRNDMVAHVYDVTYGTVAPGTDTLVVIDDSIVRGTTLTKSILRQLDRLDPKRIIVVSSSPQVRYPDYYGIDMSELSQFIAFHAAVHLLRTHHMEHIIHDTYRRCMAQRELPESARINCVKAIYAPFTEDEISQAIARLLVESSSVPFKARIDILYQSLDGLRRALPDYPGDWYFSGDYPTPGGTRLVNEAFISWYEKGYKEK